MQVPVLSNDIDVLAHTPEGQYFDRKSARIKPNDLAKIITTMLHGLVDKGILEWHGSSAKDPKQYYSLNQ